jgi:hypothetical protein
MQRRCLHKSMPVHPIPSPTPFVPDAQTFLTLIGRNLSQHASKIPTWETLFSLSSEQLRELGVEPPRARRYLIRWREKFRKGEFGIGGELQHVQDGAAEIRVVEVPAMSPTMATATLSPGMTKVIVNVAPGSEASPETLAQTTPVKGLKLKGAHSIVGPYVQPVKGTNGQVAKIVVQEGLWEHRRGHKIDGGERRQAEVRAKKRAEERQKR